MNVNKHQLQYIEKGIMDEAVTLEVSFRVAVFRYSIEIYRLLVLVVCQEIT